MAASRAPGSPGPRRPPPAVLNKAAGAAAAPSSPTAPHCCSVRCPQPLGRSLLLSHPHPPGLQVQCPSAPPAVPRQRRAPRPPRPRPAPCTRAAEQLQQHSQPCWRTSGSSPTCVHAQCRQTHMPTAPGASHSNRAAAVIPCTRLMAPRSHLSRGYVQCSGVKNSTLSIQGTAVKARRALPRPRALARFSAGSDPTDAVPVNPNWYRASQPTRGAAQAATAPSKLLREARSDAARVSWDVSPEGGKRHGCAPGWPRQAQPTAHLSKAKIRLRRCVGTISLKIGLLQAAGKTAGGRKRLSAVLSTRQQASRDSHSCKRVHAALLSLTLTCLCPGDAQPNDDQHKCVKH